MCLCIELYRQQRPCPRASHSQRYSQLRLVKRRRREERKTGGMDGAKVDMQSEGIDAPDGGEGSDAAPSVAGTCVRYRFP